MILDSNFITTQEKTIPVTQPFLPPLEEFVKSLEKIWASKWLTNKGPFHDLFEEALGDYLGVRHVSLFTNGTLALITALQALRITGEVITTPYSFVATTHSLWWNNIKPVFVDIDPVSLNLDPEKIEAAITPKTTAILAVHVYGNPCNVAAIEKIAEIYGLKVIYDSAHAFGTKIKNETILNYGDLSVLSFHATKVFNTFEGGAIISHDLKTKKRIDKLKNFGFENETTVVGPGINAKMNEFQAALGVLQLKYIDSAIERRKFIHNFYISHLNNIPGIKLMDENVDASVPYSYFPILIDSEKYTRTRDQTFEIFKQNNILARRYFYPLISEFPVYRGLASAQTANLPIANRVAKQILCLPIYPDLKIEVAEKVVNLLKLEN